MFVFTQLRDEGFDANNPGLSFSRFSCFFLQKSYFIFYYWEKLPSYAWLKKNVFPNPNLYFFIQKTLDLKFKFRIVQTYW